MALKSKGKKNTSKPTNTVKDPVKVNPVVKLSAEAVELQPAETVTDKALTDCSLKEEQVVKAVSVAFQAFAAFQEKNSQKVLLDDDMHINLLVSCIKVSFKEPRPILVSLPHPVRTKESDVCLIVKDLEKGWKINHEPTAEHYQELLRAKNISCVNEVLPLRQLRVEYKPFEAKSKLAQRFDVMLVDKRVIKFVPRYLGKAFYGYGRIPIPVDVESSALAREVDRALACSTMSMTHVGTSTQLCVGLTTQEQGAVVENIMATYNTLCKKFPGKFANVRTLALRFGKLPWTVPIYISYATRDSVTLPKPHKDTEAVVDDLTTLPPGMKVAVYRSGEVKVVKDENYQRTVLDGEEKTKPKKSKKKTKKAVKPQKKRTDDDDEDDDVSDLDDHEDLSEGEEVVTDDDEIDAEDVGAEDTSKNKAQKRFNAALKKDQVGDEESSDDGDALEDDYIQELALMEEQSAPLKEEVVDEKAPVTKTKAKFATKSSTKSTPKTSPAKKQKKTK